MDGARLFRKSSIESDDFKLCRDSSRRGVSRMPEVPPLPPPSGYLTSEATIQIDAESGRLARQWPPLPADQTARPPTARGGEGHLFIRLPHSPRSGGRVQGLR